MTNRRTSQIALTATLSLAICPMAVAAPDTDRGEIILGVERVTLKRNDDDFISSSEANKWTRPSLRGIWARDIDTQTRFVGDVELAAYSTAGVAAGSIEDDSPKGHRTIGLSLMKDVDEQRTVAFGFDYIAVVATQTEADATKEAFGFNMGYARNLDQWGYAIHAGAIVDGTEEAQDALIKAQYFGLGLEYIAQANTRLGITHSYLRGDEYDRDERKSDQRVAITSVFAERAIGEHRVSAGARYHDWRREDVAGSNIGEIQRAEGTSFFVTYSIPFGQSLTANERLVLTTAPDITEFVMVGGATMD